MFCFIWNSIRTDFVHDKEFVVCWLVCRITRRQTNIVFSPNIILFGWLGSRYQLMNYSPNYSAHKSLNHKSLSFSTCSKSLSNISHRNQHNTPLISQNPTISLTKSKSVSKPTCQNSNNKKKTSWRKKTYSHNNMSWSYFKYMGTPHWALHQSSVTMRKWPIIFCESIQKLRGVFFQK